MVQILISCLIVIILLPLTSQKVGALESPYWNVQGYVFVDTNQNGVFDKGAERGHPKASITIGGSTTGTYQGNNIEDCLKSKTKLTDGTGFFILPFINYFQAPGDRCATERIAPYTPDQRTPVNISLKVPKGYKPSTPTTFSTVLTLSNPQEIVYFGIYPKIPLDNFWDLFAIGI